MHLMVHGVMMKTNVEAEQKNVWHTAHLQK